MTYDRHTSRTLRIVLDDWERSQPPVRQLLQATASMPDPKLIERATGSMPDPKLIEQAIGSMPDPKLIERAIGSMPDPKLIERAIGLMRDAREIHQLSSSGSEVAERPSRPSSRSLASEWKGDSRESFDGVEVPAEQSESLDDPYSDSTPSDFVKVQLLLPMIVLWVWVTPYLSAEDMAQFVRWWVEFVAALLSGP